MTPLVGPVCCEGGIQGYGSTHSGIAFVGIAPGADEWRRTKRPLTGPSGKLLDAILKAVGIPRDEVYCTNLICYWKDAPTKDEIAACNPRLLNELREVSPKVIVLLGKLACETVLGMPFNKARSAVIKRGDVTYLATYHPTACLHKATTATEKELQINAAYDLCRDLLKLPAILSGKEEHEPTYTVIDTPEAAQDLLDFVLPTRGVPVALDIETNYDKEADKAHPFSDDIVCIGLGWTERSAYVLTQGCDLANLHWPRVKYVFHNGSFDTQEIARHYGIWLPISEDTMLQSYSVDERSIRGLHKLKHLAREYVGSDFYEEEEHKEDIESLYAYNAKDVVYTWRLHQYLRDWQEREGVREYYQNILLPAAEMLAHSQLRGIYVNPNNMLEVATVFGDEFYKLEEDLRAFSDEVLGDPNFNVNSPKQIMMMMAYQGYSLENTRKATLQELLDTEDIPFVKMLLRYRTLHKLIRNYLLDVQKHVKHDSRVHPHAFLTGTSTGRLTYKEPAMQTLPKPKTVKDLGIIRRIFSATNDDYILLEADYAQIEAWVAAYLSEDDVLLSDLQSGNWHTRVTEDVFKIKKSEADPLTWAFYYDGGKHLNYGCLFEEGPEGLTRRPPIGLGCDYGTAREYHARWHHRYNKFDLWREKVKKQGSDLGYVDTPFGRKRRFPVVVNDHQLRQMVNSPIQSTANDYTLMSNIRMEKRLHELDTHLLFLEHDGTYLEVAKRNLKEVVTLLHEVMESPPLPGLPSIKIEIDVGPNLASLISLNKCKAIAASDRNRNIEDLATEFHITIEDVRYILANKGLFS